MKKDYIDKEVNINNQSWRVAEKRLKYGREWFYLLSREKVDGTYESLQLNEDALESIIESGSKVMRAYNFIGDWVLDENKIKPGEM